MTLGTIATGTVTTGSLTNLATLGTIQNLNTGTLAVVAAGSHVHTAGTLTTGTLQNLVSGSVVVTVGTVTVSNYPGATAPKYSYQTVSSVSAGANGTLNFGSIASGQTGQLAKMILSSSVPIRGEIQSTLGTTPTLGTLGVMFSSAAGLQILFEPPTDTYMTLAGTGTSTNFKAIITNNDNSLAADVYGVCFWDEVTT